MHVYMVSKMLTGISSAKQGSRGDRNAKGQGTHSLVLF